LPRAARLAAEIKQARGIETRLVKGSGGQFEVSLDGQPIFSKKAQGRFPETAEILQHIPQPAAG
jgi:selT/selW/selH-like putative selenoprotein